VAAVIDPLNPESVVLPSPTAPGDDASERSNPPEQADTPGHADTPEQSRRAVLVRKAATTAGVYLGMHLITLLSVLWMLHVRKQSLSAIVHTFPRAWDAVYYMEVAHQGYVRIYDFAFYPLYPGLLRGVVTVTGLSYMQGGVILSVFTGSAAAIGLRFVGERVAGARAGLILVALWAVVPTAVVQAWIYADGLFVALAAWTLYALLKRSWLTAGVLTFFAGLTRPTAIALIATLGVVALVAVIRREDGWRPWVAAAISPLGFIGYILWVGHHFGKLGAYFQIQRKAWGNWFDFGATTYRELAAVVDGHLDMPSIPYLMAILSVVATPFLITLAVRQRLPWPLILYSVLVVVVALGSHRSDTTTARELMPAFPLLIPLAQVLTRARTRGLVISFAALAVFSAWYAWYLPMVIGVP
jgi:hypothetical protein